MASQKCEQVIFGKDEGGVQGILIPGGLSGAIKGRSSGRRGWRNKGMKTDPIKFEERQSLPLAQPVWKSLCFSLSPIRNLC